MPGPVSDSYDPEFGTGARAAEVLEAIEKLRALISDHIGSDELKNIVDLAEGYNDNTPDTEGSCQTIEFDIRELRIIRFCLDRAIESI
jgi:hypothetical protein